ncbi:MAG: MBL fold metallo-hydrolase [Candidatus Bathyarchaeia archaeon]
MVKSKTTLTFYGGVNEIGGNKILLTDRDVKVFLDFGMSFALRRRYFSPPLLSPKSEKTLQELGVLPKIHGVYRFDREEPDVDAVFISHGHMDHSAYLSFIKREIPVYCGETTKLILQAFSETRRAELEFDVEGIMFKSFRTGHTINIDGLEIEPVHVDHSVPGAYGLIIHTSSGSVVYTGDFRDHGGRPEMTRDFVNRAKDAEPVALITEATNMTGATVSSESEVEDKLHRIVGDVDGVVFAEFANTDFDRLKSFYKVAKKNGRSLVVSFKQAYLINALRKDERLELPRLNEEKLLIFRKSKKPSNGKERLRSWEKNLLGQYPDKIVESEDVSKQQRKLILSFSFYDLEKLADIRPSAGSCYIFSASEPFNEEMEIDFERLVNWLRHYGLPQYHVHVSGHIMPLRLKRILREIETKRIFPVHTENAELFAGLMQDLKGQVILPEKNKGYTL